MAKLLEVGVLVPDVIPENSPVEVVYEAAYWAQARAAGGMVEGKTGPAADGFRPLLAKSGGALLVYGGELNDPVPPMVTIRVKPRGVGVKGQDWGRSGHPRDTGDGKWDGSQIGEGAAGDRIVTEAQALRVQDITAQFDQAQLDLSAEREAVQAGLADIAQSQELNNAATAANLGRKTAPSVATIGAEAGLYNIISGAEAGQVWERLAGGGTVRRSELEAASLPLLAHAQASLTFTTLAELSAWDRKTLTAAFADGSRWIYAPAGTPNGGTVIAAAGGGVWVRENTGEVWAHWFGVLPDYVWGLPAQAATQNPERLKAALEYAMQTGQKLRVRAGMYYLPRTVEPAITDWRMVNIEGEGAASPQAIGRSAPFKPGTVFIGENNRILRFNFTDDKNENIRIVGIGFLNDVNVQAYQMPPVVIVKKNLRYISNHEIDISLNNWDAGLTWSGGNTTVSTNYIGPMRLRVNSYLTTRPIQFIGATANRCYVHNSLWHDSAGPCLFVGKGNAEGGGNTDAAFMGVLDTCHSEGALGIFEFPYNDVRDDANILLRNVIELRSVTHEFTGAVKETNGNYSGSQWAAGKNTDIFVSGRWDNPRAYGETGIPILPANTTLSTLSPMTISEEGGDVLTPSLVNNGGTQTATLNAGQSLRIQRQTTYLRSFDCRVIVRVNGGNGGNVEYRAYGLASNGSKNWQQVQEIKPIIANVTLTQEPSPAHTDMYNVVINNATATAITVDIVSILQTAVNLPVQPF